MAVFGRGSTRIHEDEDRLPPHRHNYEIAYSGPRAVSGRRGPLRNAMTPERLLALLATYRDGLLNDTLPFWIPRAIDRDCGGYLTALDQDGSVLHTDKPVWVQGRFAWLLATLYNTVERRPEWLELSRHGIDFLRKHCFDTDGRMFYSVTREGRPLRKRRYLFSESFAVIALAAYATAAGDDASRREALDLFRLILRYHTTPGLLEPKVIPETRPMKGLAMPMILLATAQELRKATNDPLCTEVIDRSIAEIESDFLKPEFRCVLETVGPRGEFYDTFEGRTVCPGHAIEAGWFILEEARRRGRDPRLIRLGTGIIDWSFEAGWDREYGGIVYLHRRPRPAQHGIPARHEALVAAQRGDHRHAPRLPAHRRHGVRPPARAGPRLGLQPLPRPDARRVVRLPPPRRERVDPAEGEHVEGAVPSAAHAVVLLAAARRGQPGSGFVSERRLPGTLGGLDYAVMGAYMLVLLALGALLRKRAGSDMESYFLAGRKMPGWLNGCSYAATCMNADVAPAYCGMTVITGTYICWWYLSRFGLALMIGAVLFATLLAAALPDDLAGVLRAPFRGRAGARHPHVGGAAQRLHRRRRLDRAPASWACTRSRSRCSAGASGRPSRS